MEAGATALLLVALLGTSSASSFYGDSISLAPLQSNADGTYKVQNITKHRAGSDSECSIKLKAGINPEASLARTKTNHKKFSVTIEV